MNSDRWLTDNAYQEMLEEELAKPEHLQNKELIKNIQNGDSDELPLGVRALFLFMLILYISGPLFLIISVLY